MWGAAPQPRSGSPPRPGAQPHYMKGTLQAALNQAIKWGMVMRNVAGLVVQSEEGAGQGCRAADRRRGEDLPRSDPRGPPGGPVRRRPGIGSAAGRGARPDLGRGGPGPGHPTGAPIVCASTASGSSTGAWTRANWRNDLDLVFTTDRGQPPALRSGRSSPGPSPHWRTPYGDAPQ